MRKGLLSATYHRDGSVTYWSVLRQEWDRAYSLKQIGAVELAARGRDERQRIVRHLTGAKR